GRAGCAGEGDHGERAARGVQALRDGPGVPAPPDAGLAHRAEGDPLHRGRHRRERRRGRARARPRVATGAQNPAATAGFRAFQAVLLTSTVREPVWKRRSRVESRRLEGEDDWREVPEDGAHAVSAVRYVGPELLEVEVTLRAGPTAH